MVVKFVLGTTTHTFEYASIAPMSAVLGLGPVVGNKQDQGVLRNPLSF